MQNSSSPSKRSSFRSRTKLKQGAVQPKQMKSVVSYKMYLKDFPLGTAEDIIKIVQLFEPVHNTFIQNLGSLKLYKSVLASQFENSWAEVMQIVRTIVIKMDKRTDKIIEEKQAKVIQLLNINSQKQQQIKRLKDKLDNLDHLRQLQNAQLAMANNEVEIVNREMSDIYAILQNDMGKILKYLTSIQESRKQESKQGSQQLYSSLDNFAVLLNSMEAEQKQTSLTLGAMREMIKAMARSTKTNTGTQVDQSELQTQAANIFGQKQQKSDIPFQVLEGTSINALGHGNFQHTLDKLKVKEKQHTHEPYHPKKSLEKPWALTPTLLIFLQNMSKQNEAGRVLPWDYMKTLISELYQERVKAQNQMFSGMIGSSMLFDEFVVYSFLKRYKIRRLAEVKLLEFIISLRYYTKFWIKAQTFCTLMDVTKYLPGHDSGDTYNYKMDLYTQNFFFQVYKRMMTFELIHEDDGTAYVATKKVKKLMKLMLFFTDDMNRSRLYVKLQKDIRIFDKVDHADFDYALYLFLEEFFNVRKRMALSISRTFSKLYQKNQGYISIDQLIGVFNQFTKIYNAGDQFPQRYPVQSQLQISKLYLYAITNGKNDYQITSSAFVQACQRYGFDSPFPFTHRCPKLKSAKMNKSQLSQHSVIIDNQSKEEAKIKQQKNEIKKQKSEEQKQKQQKPDIEIANGNQKDVTLNQQRVDVSSKLFSQHFSLIKELKDYTDIFAKTLGEEKDFDNLWKAFNQIRFVLERGCKFMEYPLIEKD